MEYVIFCLILFKVLPVQTLDLPEFHFAGSNLVSADIDLVFTSEHRERRASEGTPDSFHTAFRSGGQDVNLKFKKSKLRQDRVPFHYYENGIRYDHVTEAGSECVSVYQDQLSHATALVDFCEEFDIAPQMMIDLPSNNTQYVILPAVSGTGGRVTHQLFSIDGPDTDIDNICAVSTGESISLDGDEFNRSHRQRRAALTTRHSVELLLVLDYSLYSFWLQKSGGQNRAFEAMTRFYSFLVHAMDTRYQSLSSSGLNIRVELVAIMAAATANDSVWIERNLDPPTVVQGTRGTFDGNASLVDFEKWIQGQMASDQNFTKHDHAMLLTGRDLMILGVSGSAGYANQATVCTDKSQSIAEDHFNFLSITIMTHELGHSLGAVHDGDINTCLPEDKYIMAALNRPMFGEKARNPWKFSNCSIEAITRKLTSLNVNESTNCLLSNDNVEIIEATGAWLGQQYTPDQQCQMSHGPDSVMCKLYHTGESAEVCTHMWCSLDGLNNCTLIIPADGTTCGNKKWCINGECVESTDAPEANEACLFGDQIGPFPGGITCDSQVKTDPYYCYEEVFRYPCCTSCASIQKNVTGCEFGNHQNCSLIKAVHCYDDEIRTSSCCESCVDFVKPGLPENCKFGDKAINCIPTAAICSLHPDECCETCNYVNFTTVTTMLSSTTAAATQTGQTGQTTQSGASTTATGTGTTPSLGTTTVKDDGLPGWVIPVAAVGGGLLLIAVIGGAVCCCRGDSGHRKHRYYDREYNRRKYRRDLTPRNDRYGPDLYDHYGLDGQKAYDNAGYFGGSFI